MTSTRPRETPSLIWGAAAVTGCIALGVYLVTLAPDLTWAHYGADGAELITAAVTLGVPHPPGYPTYVWLGNLWSRIPFGTAAVRFNALSAVCTSGAAALTAAAGLKLATSQLNQTSKWLPAGVTAGLLLALSAPVWRQAVITEVYALNLLAVALLVWSLTTGRTPLISGLLLGLSITTHLTSLLLIPLALVVTAWRRWPFLFLGALLGLVPFLTIFWLARGGSPVIWGDPGTAAGWAWLVSGRLFAPNVLALPPGEWAGRAADWMHLLVTPLVVLPFYPIWRRQNGNLVGRRRLDTMIVTALLFLFYGFFYRTIDAVNYVLPAILLVSVPLTLMVRRLGWWGLILPVALLTLNFDASSLQSDQGVREKTELLLESIPAGAILLTPGDETLFTLWYFQHVEAARPDVTIVDANMLAFDWYRLRLTRRYPHLTALDEDDADHFRSQNQLQQPLCTVSLNNLSGTDCQYQGNTFALDFP